jgi:hypothetical protein
VMDALKEEYFERHREDALETVLKRERAEG